MRELTEELLLELGWKKSMTGIQSRKRDYLKYDRSREGFYIKDGVMLWPDFTPFDNPQVSFKYLHELEEYLQSR